jgi:hypothetical protein
VAQTLIVAWHDEVFSVWQPERRGSFCFLADDGFFRGGFSQHRRLSTALVSTIFGSGESDISFGRESCDELPSTVLLRELL